MNAKYFSMSETIGFEVKSAKDIFAAKELGLFICDENDYYFDDVVVDTDEDGNETDRDATEDEKTERAIEHLRNGGKVYATFCSDNYMLVDKKATTLQTDFFVGQEVYLMNNNKICKGEIYRVELAVEKEKGYRAYKASYKLMYPYAQRAYNENEIFATKEELVKHLMED